MVFAAIVPVLPIAQKISSEAAPSVRTTLAPAPVIKVDPMLKVYCPRPLNVRVPSKAAVDVNL